jgi:hypothetical protein
MIGSKVNIAEHAAQFKEVTVAPRLDVSSYLPIFASLAGKDFTVPPARQNLLSISIISKVC